MLAWDGQAWTVRDLASRNGTWVDGQRLPPGGVAPLNLGSTLRFGTCAGTYFLASAGLPAAFAQSDDGQAVAAEGGLLVLGAEVSVHALSSGDWVVDAPSGLDAVEDRDLVVVGTRSWKIYLPNRLPSTLEMDDALPVAAVTVHFRVASNQEHVEVELLAGSRVIPLGARVHHYLLLVLARLRLEHTAEGEPPESCGWVDKDVLAKMMGIDNNLVHTHIHRVRRQLAVTGLLDAANVIERRLGARELRIGIRAFTFEDL